MGIRIDIVTNDSDAKNIKMNGETARLRMGWAPDKVVGGKTESPGIFLFPQDGSTTDNQTATISLQPNLGNLKMGGRGGGGVGAGADGDILLFPKTGDIWDNATATIHLDADAGDIVFQNADCAEEFEISARSDVRPGAVVVLTDEGHIQESSQPYDKRVMGVISGAGSYRPGIVLDRQTTGGRRAPVAMMGKVYCKVDASFGKIEIGDLLSTSTTPGHAMKATDASKAFGTVIGKALKPWTEGVGLIPVLVSRH